MRKGNRFASAGLRIGQLGESQAQERCSCIVKIRALHKKIAIMAVTQPWLVVFCFGEGRSLQHEERCVSIPERLESGIACSAEDRASALLTQLSGFEDRLQVRICLYSVLGVVGREKWKQALYSMRSVLVLKHVSEPPISTFPGLPCLHRHATLVQACPEHCRLLGRGEHCLQDSRK